MCQHAPLKFTRKEVVEMNAPLVELRLKVKVVPGTYNTESIRGQNPIKAVVIGDSDAPEYVYLELQNGVALFFHSFVCSLN